MDTKSEKANAEGFLPDSNFNPPQDRRDAPRSHKKVTKFRDLLSKKR